MMRSEPAIRFRAGTPKRGLAARAIRALGRWAGKLAGDCRGSILVWSAFAMPVVFGMAGLGLDTGIWFLERRVMQSAVDSAALSASLARTAGGNQTQIEAAVQASFTKSNFTLVASDILQVNAPPLTGPNTGSATAVAVIVQRKPNLLLASLVTSQTVNVRARAVSGAVIVGTHCILALDEDVDSAVEFTGTAVADLNCGVASNSSSSKAIHVGGMATLSADPAQAYGDIFVEGSATLITNSPPQPNSPRVTDPFGPQGRDLQIPLLGTCTPVPDLSGMSGTITLNPGHYCGDLVIENKTVVFTPGTYIFESGNISIKAGSVVTGDGVTFILTSPIPAQVGRLEFASQSDITLTAPSTGTFAGILIFEDINAATHDGNGVAFKHTVAGGTNTTLKGAIYTPARHIEFTGGSNASGQCLYLVARRVTITGNAVINNDPAVCESLGLESINQVRIRLVE